jgi:CubicO group peptidase (beta-lactamase class C family)
MKKVVVRSYILFLILGCSFFSLWYLGSFYFESSGRNQIVEKLGVASSEPDYWPTSGWRTSLPEEEGLPVQKLDDMEDYIENQNFDNYMDSLLIIRNGYLVYEWYPLIGYNEDIRHHLYSCTKVFTSALIGVAIEEGYIGGVDDHVLDYFPNKTFDNMDARKQAITIKHLLTMTSGIEWMDDPNYYQMSMSSDWVKYVLDRPMEFDPGTVWNYNTGCSHLLSAILNEVTPNGTRAFAIERIFKPLNITNYLWENDAKGIPIGGTLLYLTPRDMAKFGFLYLNNGQWNGTQLIPSSWVVESSTSFVSLEFEEGQGSGYGYQWWIYRWANAYTALGSNEQHIVVIPDYNLIVISTGNTYFPFIRLLVDYILPAVRYNQTILGLVITLVVGFGAVGAVFCYAYYQSYVKKKYLREIKEQSFNEIKN